MVLKTFIVYHILQYFFRWFKVVPRPIKGLFTNWFSCFVVKSFKIRVSKTLFYVKSFYRAEMQHFSKEIESDRITFWK